jgi:chromosome partitioning protein
MNEPIFSANEPMPASDIIKKAHVIVLGNEKGGSGKTTTGMHLIVALLRLGFKVGSMDIDSRQRSLSRYLENRRQTMLKEGVTLPQPHHIVVQKSPLPIVQEAETDDRDRFTKALARLAENNDFVVIDSPGSDTYMARLAHAYANTVITPINDSFVDLDVIATVDGQTMRIIKPSIYSEMMWEQKLNRAKRDGGSIEWIVMRNRLSNIDAKNKRFMTQVTTDLSRRIGFRVAPGFSERVIFREMFLQGLTVLDIMEMGKSGLSLSHVAARQEVRDLLKTLHIARVDEKLSVATAAETTKEEETADSTVEKEPPTPVAVKELAPAVPEAKPQPALSAETPAPTIAAKPQPALETAAPVVATPPNIRPLFGDLPKAATSPVIETRTPAPAATKPPTDAEIATRLEKLLAELAS